MPADRGYKRRGRRNNRRRRNNKVSVYTKKSAKAQATQIWKNQKQITALQNKMKDTYSRYFYNMASHSSVVTYPGIVFPLVDPSALASCFNTPWAKTYDNHCRFNYIDLKGIVQIEAGDSVVMVDLFVLQLKKGTAEQTRQDLQDNLSGLVDTFVSSGNGKWNGKYYYNTGNAGLEGRRGTMMNPDAFNIRAHRSFLVGDKAESGTILTPGEDVDNIGDANKPFHIRINHPVKLEVAVGQDQGGTEHTWKKLTVGEVEPAKQLYLFVSCNAVEGTRLFVDWNALVSVNEPS